MENYKDEFLKAVSLGNSITPRHSFPIVDLRKYLNKSTKKIPNEKYYEHVKNLVLRYFCANDFIHPSHKCLEYSARALQLIEDAQDQDISPPVPVFLTIGNVKYKGKYIDAYKVSEKDIKSLVEVGPNNSKINLHAWVTLYDLTVFDLTLQYTLYEQGEFEGKPSVLIGQNDKSDFEFEPIVVNNLFDRLVCYGGLERSLV